MGNWSSYIQMFVQMFVLKQRHASSLHKALSIEANLLISLQGKLTDKHHEVVVIFPQVQSKRLHKTLDIKIRESYSCTGDWRFFAVAIGLNNAGKAAT